jgi:hypothetical protein
VFYFVDPAGTVVLSTSFEMKGTVNKCEKCREGGKGAKGIEKINKKARG